ncbi:helix-turn-helix transcriptional regulator [Methylorubrum extorquens]|uniref:Helix-turn-helix domain-containing protein n=1 Tax=Methylorubrum extorquens DSM 13060 TaxID=882800 RepID=H1KBZ9_METEX|nr:hypothetical protein [Methylorubrum extorquens]EHP94996.1 hypothetical protein MetexDRAFT_0161 [Methylorubrum extorquens DSM 13060]
MRKRVPSEEPITLQEIEEARDYVTYIVGKYGDAYLPVLRRLEREVEAARQKESRGDRARRAEREAEARIQPRGMTRDDAAAYCSLSPSTWDRWVSDGRMPPPVPGTHRWDRKAIDLAWDRLSGIATTTVDASDAAMAAWRASRGR